MAECLYRCPTLSGVGFEGKWEGLRWHYGPRTMSSGRREDLFAEDTTQFIDWANEYGRDSYDADLFGKWLNWKITTGSDNYGNLSTRIRDHVGVSCVLCPYDTPAEGFTNEMWDERSRVWTGSIPTTYVDHGNYYMRVVGKGSAWGWECSYPNCPHNADHGYPYFHV